MVNSKSLFFEEMASLCVSKAILDSTLRDRMFVYVTKNRYGHFLETLLLSALPFGAIHFFIGSMIENHIIAILNERCIVHKNKFWKSSLQQGAIVSLSA